MKVTYPLSLKVSVWLLLNLLLLGALGVGFFVVQGGLGWDALVAGATGNRVQTTANVIAGEAAAATADGRTAVLDRFGTHFSADFFLYRMDDTRIAGADVELPPEVHARMQFVLPRGGPGGFGPRSDFGPGRGGFKGGKGDMRRFPPEGEKGPPRVEPITAGQPDASEPARRGSPNGNEQFKGPPRREPNDKVGRESPDMGRGRPPFEPGRERGRFLVRAGAPAGYWLGVPVPFALLDRGRPAPVMLVARVGSFWDLLRLLDLQSWLLAGTGVLVLSVLFWLPLVRGITQAIGQLTTATEQIADGRFDTRVPSGRRDELGKLGESVNRMATNLDAHMTGQKRFLGDVAHELCSPLARLQMATGILTDRAPPELHGTVADLREEVQQMSALVNELLAFTKAGLQQRPVVLGKLAVAPIVQDTLAREDAKGRTTAIVPGGLEVLADADLLARALGNLIRNALRYSGTTEAIMVSARREGDRVIVAIDDDGPGVPAEALDRLGEPFFRPEAARTRELGGVGLGLSIVRSAIVACGGEVRFSNRTPHGFRAEIVLAAA